MDVGLALPQFDYSVAGESPLSWTTVEAWADAAVAAGLTSLWLADHLFLSIEKYGGPPTEHGCFDPVVGLASLATRHATASVGCLVFCAPLRPPRLLAKQIETLDALAPGRVVAGIGAGWYEREFTAAGIPFERPGARLRDLAETVDVIKAFLGDGDEARTPPVWVGGKGDRLLDIAARHADGWNTVWAWTPDAYRERLSMLARACEAADRDPASVTLSLGLTTLVGENEADVERRFDRLRTLTPGGVLDGTTLEEWRVGRLVGTVDQVREQVAAWRAIGIAVLIANLGALPFSVTDPADLALVASALT